MSAEPEEVTFQSVGATLYGYVWPARHGSVPATYVVMSHGLTNHHEDAPMFELLRDRFVANGLGVFMFDYFGSGKSDGLFQDKTWSGMRANLADALDFVQSTRLQSGGHFVLVARSVGASVAGFFARDPRVVCTVLASPVLYLVDRFGDIRKPGSTGVVRMPESLERSGQIKGEWALNQEFFDELWETEHELASAIANAQRVLLLHGDDDPKVAEANSVQIYELLAEPKRYVRISGGDHYYTGREDEVTGAILDWVVRQTSIATPAAVDI